MAATPHHVAGAVHQAARHLRASAVTVRLARWTAVSLGWWLAVFVLDNLLRLPSGLRFPLAAAGAALFPAAAWAFARGARRRPPEAVAVALEGRFAIPHNLLVNALQFERHPVRREQQPFADRTLSACRSVLPRVRVERLWDRRRLGRWGGGAVACLALWAAYLGLFPRYAANAASRFARPMADRPPVGAYAVTVVPSSDVVIMEGEDLTVRAAVRGGPAGRSAPPPAVGWREGVARLDPDDRGMERALMGGEGGQPGIHAYTFARVRRPFTFRVFAGDAYSAAVSVAVRPRPAVTGSSAEIRPPAYTGLGPVLRPGPPAALGGLSGSVARIVLRIEPPVAEAWWTENGRRTPLAAAEQGAWTVETPLAEPGGYEIAVRREGVPKDLVIARGDLVIDTDRAPQVDFTTEDRNRLVSAGEDLRIDLEGTDDFGLRAMEVTARLPDGDGAPLKSWVYLGPPGPKGPAREGFVLRVDPARFEPGRTYLVEALAADFAPAGRVGRSRPLVLRVKSPEDYTLPPGDPLDAAFERLRLTIGEQQKALGLTAHLALHLDEARAREAVGGHAGAMTRQQRLALEAGGAALGLFRRAEEGGTWAARLTPLVEGEMPWVLADLSKLAADPAAAQPGRVAGVRERQAFVLARLLELLGRVADERRLAAAAAARFAPDEPLPVTRETAGTELRDELEAFAKDQEKILAASRTLADRGPADLTEEEQEILGELAREEAAWAGFFEEKLTDFSKLPNQDFADGSLAQELNEVYQEVQLAAAELYAKNVELAVPHEQSGLESAEELVQNLEKWLSDVPDNLKWMMEEPLAPPDIPMAELPAELEDIAGELLDSEEAMSDEVEDVTSSWMDSIDKGAGWTATDGPISSMSAKGITGNLLPNQQEIGGRSGEGRTGRSHGQMVEDAAEGKDGRRTPTRLTPGPFEPGSVEDASTGDPGGATGGGKLSGYSEAGLRGPAPAPPADAPRLLEPQARIRQEAEALALKLRAYRLSSGDMESAASAMTALEAAARRGDGPGVRQAFHRALDALKDAGRTLRTEKGLQMERAQLPGWVRDEILAGYREGMPRGYEDIVSAYFRSLAGQPSAAAGAGDVP